MKKLIFAFTFFMLSACVHKINITQGNIISPQNISRLHVGMNSAQVKNIMGQPILTNTFNDNRIEYIYTFKPGHERMTIQYVILNFKNGVLKEISTSPVSPL